MLIIWICIIICNNFPLVTILNYTKRYKQYKLNASILYNTQVQYNDRNVYLHSN